MEDNTRNKLGRFYCEQCHGRFDAAGDCPKCPGEPLLDLADEDVRLMLEEMDHAAKTRRFGMLAMVSAVLAVPVFFILSATCSWLLAIPGAALFAGGLATVLSFIFKPKQSAPKLTESEIRFLERPGVEPG